MPPYVDCVIKLLDKSKFDVNFGFIAPSAKCKIENVKCKIVGVSPNIITFSFNFSFFIFHFSFFILIYLLINQNLKSSPYVFLRA